MFERFTDKGRKIIILAREEAEQFNPGRGVRQKNRHAEETTFM